MKQRGTYTLGSLLTAIFLTVTLITSAQNDNGDNDSFSCDDAQHPTECEALVAIYEATGGENWWNNDGWLKSPDVCNWHGITCDEARQVSKLDLYRNGLVRDLPPEIDNLTNLQSLNLRRNALTSLPVEIGNLANLQRLDLGDNDLTSLPAEIGSLANLQRLDLRDNALTSLPPEIGSLTNLQSLVLWDNVLTSLPAEIGSLTNLQRLDLGVNALASLPAAIGSLTNLQSLVLWDNVLTSLPAEIGSLTNLQQLDLWGNPLICVPDAVSELTDTFPPCSRVTEPLELTFECAVTRYPAECEALVAVYNSTYGTNWRIDNVWLESPDVCNWHGITCDENGHIEKIDLSSNKLVRDLPPEIGNLSNLQRLDLGDNALTSLPPEIGNLSNLRELSLSWCYLPCLGNPLTALPPQIGNLTNLQELNLAGNRLTSLPPEIGNLTNLEKLDVRDNPLTCVPEGVAHLVDYLPVCESE